MLLSDRMLAVAGLVQPCSVIADIGCDHGYVAMELIRRHVCDKVIAMDINQGPLEQAKSNIRDYGMQEFIETRLSDGTQALEPGEADGIICAGMGGKLTIHILAEGRELIRHMQQLILQPQSEIKEVRSFLREEGYQIDREDMVCEDGKYYPMMHVSTNGFGKQEEQLANNLTEKSRQNIENKTDKLDTIQVPVISEISKEEAEKIRRVQDTYGPCLLQQGHPILKRYLLWQKENLENIRGNLMSQRQPTPRQQYRIAELDHELSDIVFCLYKYFS